MSSYDNVQLQINRLLSVLINDFAEVDKKRQQKEKEFVDYADSLIARIELMIEEKEKKETGKNEIKPKGTKVKKEQVPTDLANITAGPGKPRRMASQIASRMINKQVLERKNFKLRRPSGSSDLIASQKAEIALEVIKTEEADEDPESVSERCQKEMMPVPTITRTKNSRQKNIESESDSDSDTTDTETSIRSVRSTRSKAIKKPEVKNIVEGPIRSSHTKEKQYSDVLLIPNEPVPCVSLTDTDSEENIPLMKIKHQNKKKDSTKHRKKNLIENEDKENATEEREKQKIKSEEKNENKNKLSDSSEKSVERKRQKYDSGEEEFKPGKKRTKKIKRTKNTKKLPEKIPIIALEDIKQEKTIYEDALSQSKESEVPNTPKPCNATYQVLPAQLNSTPIMVPSVINQTVTIAQAVLSETRPVSVPVLHQTTSIVKDSSGDINLKDDDVLQKDGILEEKTEENVVLSDCKVSLEKIPIVEEKLNEKLKNANETTVLTPKNQKWEKSQEILNEKPDLTDDDSMNPIKKKPKQLHKKFVIYSSESDSSPEQPKPKKGLKTKQMFSPYADSPVRKRVAAFEKMGSDDKTVSAATTTRVTRTKTKKLIADKENTAKLQETKIPSSKVPSKYTTPVQNNRYKKCLPHTDGRVVLNTKQNTTTLSKSSESQRSHTALKLTRAQLIEKNREQQKLRSEKENEAIRKKEAMMQAKVEETKRLREEKMQRAQKAREENERQKEEKIRQALAEKEEKQKDEMEKKRAWQAEKAAEVEEQRRIVERNRILRQKKEEEEHRRRLYLALQEAKAKRKPPALPTVDCYDTDEENCRPKVQGPDWCRNSRSFPILREMGYIPKTNIYNHFSVKPTTPDLEDIFESIPTNYLHRNSSAVWRTPPRYSTLTLHNKSNNP